MMRIGVETSEGSNHQALHKSVTEYLHTSQCREDSSSIQLCTGEIDLVDRRSRWLPQCHTTRAYACHRVSAYPYDSDDSIETIASTTLDSKQQVVGGFVLET